MYTVKTIILQTNVCCNNNNDCVPLMCVVMIMIINITIPISLFLCQFIVIIGVF